MYLDNKNKLTFLNKEKIPNRFERNNSETEARLILESINEEFDTDINFLNIDSEMFNSSDIENLKNNYLANGYLTAEKL